jgi:hypothetical protein
MNKEERDQLGRKLAKLVDDPPPILKDDADLGEYLAYVEMKLYFLRQEERVTLLEARLVDPQFAAAMKKKQEKHWKGVNHRRSLPKQGTAALHKQGAQTRSAVVKAWNSLSNVSKHNRAALVAQRLKISDRTVRAHLKTAGLT